MSSARSELGSHSISTEYCGLLGSSQVNKLIKPVTVVNRLSAEMLTLTLLWW